MYAGSKETQKKKLSKLTQKKEKKSKEINLSGQQLKKWVVNTSKRQLTEPEVSVLAKGLNFAVTLEKLPVEEYVVVTEKACGMVPEEERERLRAEISGALKSTKRPLSNISKQERVALKQLKKDNTITILPADKGRATVVLDSEGYEQKVKMSK